MYPSEHLREGDRPPTKGQPVRRHRPLLVLLGSLLAATVLVPAAASADGPARVPVGGSEGTKSSRVVREGTDIGPADPAAQVTTQVFLAGDTRRLADYARAVSDPRDFRYGHFLTPGQVRARFGPAQHRIDAVSGWLRGTGLSIVSAGPRAVVARGTVAQAAVAFGTRFDNYTYQQIPFRAAVDPTVPAGFGPDILTVTGLTVATGTWQPPGPPTTGSRTAARVGTPASPCPDHYGDTPAADLPSAYGHPVQWAPCGYTPRQCATRTGSPEPASRARG